MCFPRPSDATLGDRSPENWATGSENLRVARLLVEKNRDGCSNPGRPQLLATSPSSGSGVEGAVQRLRAKFMNASTLVIGLAPILWADGLGVDVLKRIAAPMVGGRHNLVWSRDFVSRAV